MKVSVIMPVYNRERLIASSIHSLLRHTDSVDLDIIVIDDGSQDGTIKTIKDLSKGNPIIRLVEQEHAGVARARNTGLRNLLPETEIVTFLDSDDISPMGRFDGDMRLLEADPDLDVVYGIMMLADEIDDHALAAASGSRSVLVRGASTSAGLFRRRSLANLGGFDETFVQAEDTDFLFRLFEMGPKYHKSDTIAVIYRRHPGNTTNDTDKLRRTVMRAIHKSIKRRRSNSNLASLEDIFDLNPLLGVDWL